ncbi:MAG: spermidine/putrescine ABC transporter substrate-binding protein [Caldilineaceae bacterium]|jgi:spermidine/putrescine transport system substrate-binding protein|nr:spermidine/putrescine ABC transporter substrate-binding protein [Caldilineaceae bacterium]
MRTILVTRLIYMLGCVLLAACTQAAPTPAPPQLAPVLMLYNWAEYMPQSVLDAFTEEYGVEVNYISYKDPEEAMQNIRDGVVYDVVILPPETIASLIAEDRLAAINYGNVPNFRNVSINFRDLIYDPGNRYSIPFHWGATGLLVRTDLVETPVTKWADLWDARYAGKIALWPISRDLIPISLKSLGYSANSVNPEELNAAVQHLVQLKPHALWWDNKEASIVPALVDGQAVIAFGWAYDALLAREESAAISYILPEEGTFLWSDNFVIPANSQHKATAELFLNFVLRADISAQIINESYYPVANDAAEPLVNPELLADPIVYLPEESLRKAEVIVPLGADGENLYAELWQQFLASTGR